MVRQKGGLRVVLTVDLIMQSVAVEVDAAELEPLDSGTPGNAKGSATWLSVRTA